MIPLTLARLPDTYQTLSNLENQIAADYGAGKLDMETIKLWIHQALMADLLNRLPETPDFDETLYPETTHLSHLRWMLKTGWETDMAVDKAARWLAYVQGVCAVHGWIDVQKEREHTRHILHLPARITGSKTPPSLGPEQ